jgi:hypothetical protein
MTAQVMILPYQRSSPLHIPRRDLVLGSADSLALRVTVVESDDPSAPALELTGGIGGPGCSITVWRDGPGGPWDYGAPPAMPGSVLWTGTGTDSDAVGSFDIDMPVGQMADWPLRCGFAIRLDWDGGLKSELLAHGSLHVRHVPGAAVPTAEVITTDIPPLDPITTD